MSLPKYIEKEYNAVSSVIKDNLVLLLTVTDLETKYTHLKLKPLNGLDGILKVHEGDLTYYIGVLGNYKVAHVQCSMGSISRASSIVTVTTALGRTNAKVVIMVGIAFGVNAQKQQIGDVLISESIIPYNVRRVGKTETVQRGIEAPSSKILLDRFKSIKTWEHFISDGVVANLIPTRLLSGEDLIDNLEHRNQLIKENPDSKGGEMEGAGVYAACDGKAQWILLKGICDFADGEKGTNKEEQQTIAITSALSACLEIFNSYTAFNDLNVFPNEVEQVEIFSNKKGISNVLFDVYDEGKEEYYIQRDVDLSFIQTLNQFSVWIFGPSGCGKSNLIFRNLIQSKKKFIQVSLASCVGLNVEEFFKEILYDIAGSIEGLTMQVEPKTFPDCNKAIVEILNKYYSDSELVIFIEEIPISSEEAYKEFSSKIFSLLILKRITSGLDNVKFVLSSINSPVKHIQMFQQKIHEQLSFVQFIYWEEKHIKELIRRIKAEFNLEVSEQFELELIKASGGSPRVIKKFFRNIYALNKAEEEVMQSILKETKRELSQYNA